MKRLSVLLAALALAACKVDARIVIRKDSVGEWTEEEPPIPLRPLLGDSAEWSRP